MVYLCFPMQFLLNSEFLKVSIWTNVYFGEKAEPFKMIGSLTNVVKTKKHIIVLDCTLILKK